MTSTHHNDVNCLSHVNLFLLADTDLKRSDQGSVVVMAPGNLSERVGCGAHIDRDKLPASHTAGLRAWPKDSPARRNASRCYVRDRDALRCLKAPDISWRSKPTSPSQPPTFLAAITYTRWPASGQLSHSIGKTHLGSAAPMFAILDRTQKLQSSLVRGTLPPPPLTEVRLILRGTRPFDFLPARRYRPFPALLRINQNESNTPSRSLDASITSSSSQEWP